MKHLKLLVVSACLVSVIAAVVLLYRRTNILLSHYENVNKDLNSIKSFLTKNVKPPATGPVVRRGAPVANLRKVVGGAPVLNPQREVLEKRVNTAEPNTVEPLHKIENTQDNIEKIRASIEQLEGMISSSSEYDSEDADDESYEETAVGGKGTAALLDTSTADGGRANLVSNNLESYDLDDIEDENSELEDLINSPEVETAPTDTISTVSNPQESNEINNKSITEAVTVDIIINRYTKKSLENLCGDNYLSKSGNKSVLIQRLLDNGYNFNQSGDNDVEATVSN